jgi:hypothetical protein
LTGGLTEDLAADKPQFDRSLIEFDRGLTDFDRRFDSSFNRRLDRGFSVTICVKTLRKLPGIAYHGGNIPTWTMCPD